MATARPYRDARRSRGQFTHLSLPTSAPTDTSRPPAIGYAVSWRAASRASSGIVVGVVLAVGAVVGVGIPVCVDRSSGEPGSLSRNNPITTTIARAGLAHLVRPLAFQNAMHPVITNHSTRKVSGAPNIKSPAISAGAIRLLIFRLSTPIPEVTPAMIPPLRQGHLVLAGAASGTGAGSGLVLDGCVRCGKSRPQ